MPPAPARRAAPPEPAPRAGPARPPPGYHQRQQRALGRHRGDPAEAATVGRPGRGRLC
jgi:hypothetical protein